jgi:hypothetical protein
MVDSGTRYSVANSLMAARFERPRPKTLKLIMSCVPAAGRSGRLQLHRLVSGLATNWASGLGETDRVQPALFDPGWNLIPAALLSSTSVTGKERLAATARVNVHSVALKHLSPAACDVLFPVSSTHDDQPSLLLAVQTANCAVVTIVTSTHDN